jgi:ACT domain-containing protein
MITIAIFIGLSLAVVFLFFYMFARDKAIERKFHMISAALENINQEIYKLQKQQKDNSLQNIETMIAEQLDEVIQNLIDNINQSQYANKKEIELLFDKISKLESNVRTMSLPNLDPINNKKDSKDKIKELYEIGYSIEEIAKETGLPAGEVNLLLKF